MFTCLKPRYITRISCLENLVCRRSSSRATGLVVCCLVLELSKSKSASSGPGESGGVAIPSETLATYRNGSHSTNRPSPPGQFHGDTAAVPSCPDRFILVPLPVTSAIPANGTDQRTNRCRYAAASSAANQIAKLIRYSTAGSDKDID